MKIVPLKTWEQFEEAAALQNQQIEDLRQTQLILSVSEPLFRGHACASWKLETTLDRLIRFECNMEEYFRVIRGVRPAIVTITGTPWELPDDFTTRGANPVPVGYEFMIYLRHHGFPSPLMDWSRSPYVAAFFAFRSKHQCDEQNVAIYSYIEWLGRAKGWGAGEPTIFGLGPYVVSHKRHYAQQCEYTICKKEIADQHWYCNHEHAVSRDRDGQDHLTKFVIPKSERPKALRKLELMNVTAFSLFGSEESLMETLSYQELEKRLFEKQSLIPPAST